MERVIPLQVTNMKKIPIYIRSLAIGLTVCLLALLQGCTRVETLDPTDPLEKEPAEDIVFAPSILSTKALINSNNLSENGTQIKVYDFISGFDGQINGSPVTSSQTVKYFTNKIAFDSQTTTYWPYCDPATTYPWTKSGVHSFFGWLAADGNYIPSMDITQLFGNGQPYFDESTRVPSIPTTTMGPSQDMVVSGYTPQFDFSYSDVVSIDAATRVPGSVVPMQLKHLFSAFKLTVMNTSGNSVVIKSVTLTGMKNRRSATIDFKTATPTVQNANLSSVDVPLYTYSGEDYGYEFVNQDAKIENILMQNFLLMWPQTYAELSDATTPASLEIVYKVRTIREVNNETVISDSDELTAHVVLNKQNFFKTNSTGMDAGVKYEFTLQFKKSSLDIYTRVLPWEYEEYDWDYSNRSISARSGTFKDGVLAFYRYNPTTGLYTVEPTTDEWSAKTMRFTTRNEVLQGRFYIEAPTSGRWQVTAYPMSVAQYFVIEPTSGDIDVNTENGKAEFTVSVNPDISPSSTQTLFFNVAIFFNGEWHDADSEFNRKNIRLVLDAN